MKRAPDGSVPSPANRPSARIGRPRRTAPVAAALLGVALSAGPAAAQSARPAACVSRVALDGDPALVHPVRAQLEADGFGSGSGRRSCGALTVHLSAEDGKVRVTVTDAAGRDDSRLLSDAATAAVFVESRARSDLAMAMPTPGPEPAPDHTAPATPKPAAIAEPPALQVSARAAAVPAASVRFRPGFSVASDGSAWLDVSASGCVRIDPLCLGATLRGSLDLGTSGRSAELLTERGGLDAMVSAELPIRAGEALQLTPGIAVGAGWLRAGPRGRAETPTSGEVSANFGGLRLEAFARASWSIAELWAVGFSVYGVVDPLAHTGDVRDPQALLAGSPRLRIGAALELTYGVP